MVTIPTWKTALAGYGPFLQGVTAEALPEVIPRLSEIGRQIRDPQGMLLTPKQIAGKLSGDAWVWRCSELGINGAPLYNTLQRRQTTYRAIELRCLPIWEKIQKQNGRPGLKRDARFVFL